MSRYPFQEACAEYIELMSHGAIKPSTLRTLKNKLKWISNDTQYLYENERISTTNPAKITPEDVLQYIGLWRDGETRGKELEEIYVSRLLSFLKKILVYKNNNAVTNFELKYASLVPTKTSKRLQPLRNSEINRIMQYSERVADDDWNRLEGYAMTIMSLCAGCRPLEIRALLASDVNLCSRVVHIEYVKGAGDYGMPRDAPILEWGIPFLSRYTDAREKKLAEIGCTTNIMFPTTSDRNGSKAGEEMSENRMNQLKNYVVLDTGIAYNIRSCRRTYVYTLLNSRIPDTIVAKCAGHTVATMHKHYTTYTCEQSVQVAQTILDRRESIVPNLPMPIAPVPLADARTDQNNRQKIENPWEMSGYV